jgi:peptidyl-prolyl cis-trans isomerase D
MDKPKPKRNTGVMNKMRDKMALIMIVLIVAFLGTIVFDWGMNYLGIQGGEKIVFAKINGVEISNKDYETLLQRQVDQIREQNKGKDIDDATYQQTKEQVWNYLVQQTLKEQEMQRLGIKVSDEEILDWVYNQPETLPDWLRNNFIDSAGIFHPEALQGAIQEPQNKAKWVEIEQYLKKILLDQKLNTQITSSVFIPEEDVLQKYKDDNIKANFSYLLVDLSSLTDTNLYTVSDQEMRKYYDEHKDEFKQEEAAKFKYVVFNDQPNADDSLSVKRLLEVNIKEMKNSEVEDSSLIKLVNDISSTPFNNEFQKANTLGKEALQFLFDAKPNDVSSLIIDQDGYKIIKLLDFKEGEDVFVNASQILINTGSDTVEAKKKAYDAFGRIKRGENFEALVSEVSEDPSSKQTKGDIGWFTKGAMVKEFEDACMNANVGDIVGPIKTQFGYHIIKVKGKSKKEFKVAEIKKPVTASARTKEIARKKASDFIKEVEKSQGSFFSCGVNKKITIDTLAKNMNMMAMTTPEISKNGFVPGAGQNNNIINFGLNNGKNKIFGPVKVQGGYGVYQVIDKIPEGYKNFDSIKIAMIKPKIQQKKKFEALLQITNDLKNKIQNGDLASLKAQYPQYLYETADSVSVTKPDAKIGMDYNLYNTVLSMKQGEISAPIKGVKGYYIVKMNTITPFNEQDYLAKQMDIRKQMLQTKQQSIIQDWLTSLQANSEIEDNRDRYLN